MTAVAWALRLALAAVFLWAGVAKLVDPAGFAEEIANYRFFPALAPILAATLPSIEILVGAVLLVGPRAWRAGAALLALVLLVVFTAAVTASRLRGIDLRCGCFGVGGAQVTWLTVARDVLFCVAALALVRLR
jgi:putative oxidoreductase